MTEQLHDSAALEAQAAGNTAEGAKEARRPTRADGRATRAKLLDAARTIIMEEGTDRLTIDRVIKLAGMSKGSFLYHFPSRDHLLEALVDDYANHLADVQTSLEAASPDAAHPLLASYLAWYEQFQEGEIDQGSSPLVALVMASRRNRRFLEPVRSWYRHYFDRLEAMSAQNAPDAAYAPGTQGCDKTEALLLTLAMDGLFFHQLFGTDVLTNEERAAVTGRIAVRSGNSKGKRKTAKK